MFFLIYFFNHSLYLFTFSCASVSLTVCLFLFLSPPLPICMGLSLCFSAFLSTCLCVCESVFLRLVQSFSLPFFPLPSLLCFLLLPNFFLSDSQSPSFFSQVPPWCTGADSNWYLVISHNSLGVQHGSPFHWMSYLGKQCYHTRSVSLRRNDWKKDLCDLIFLSPT